MTDAVTAKWRKTLNKVPEVTIFFWVIKVLCTTVGETASDFLNINLNLGLTGTSIVMGALLAVALVVQLRAKRYGPVVYWLNVVLISIFGTLVTDNLTDALGFPLEYSTLLFSGLLLITFVVWYRLERTLSIHSIFTMRREAFYWLAVLFTFALGTAAGDLMAEALGLGYATTGLIIAVIIALVTAAWRIGLDPILAFWVAYIMTRPLGASLGDLLTQSKAHGGLGLGATLTTVVFAAGILVTVLYLAVSKCDVTEARTSATPAVPRRRSRVASQVAVVAILFAAASAGGYTWRLHQLQAAQAVAAEARNADAPLGDLSSFRAMTQAMLDSVNSGDWPGANGHADDIEYALDQAESRLKPMNAVAWTNVDDAIDNVLREVRSVSPNRQTARSALEALLDKTANP